MTENSLSAIKGAIGILKSKGAKITQRNVAIETGLSLRTIKNYWAKRDLNDNEWQKSLMQKIHKIKEGRNKTGATIKKLLAENEQLKKLNKELMDSAFDKARNYLDEEAKLNFCNWVTGVGRKFSSNGK